jgi:hypothetical protein
MRTYSGANLKHNTNPRHMIPREGTKLRKLWDALQANPGQPVLISGFFESCANPMRSKHAALHNLTMFWGLEIAYTYDTWALMGEWKGRDYHVYKVHQQKVKEQKDKEKAPDPVEVPFWGS